MEIKSFKNYYVNDVTALLSDNTPYVLPHHPYVYWIMGEYFPSINLIAMENNKIIGFVCALHSSEKNSIFIWQLVVDRVNRRTGAAKLLCEKLIKYANENEIKSVQITINDENVASISFFTALAKQYGKTFEKIIIKDLNRFENESAYEIKL